MITEHDRDEDELAEASPAPSSARWPLLLGVAAAALALDQLTKAWAVERLGDGEIIDLVGSLRLRLTMNYGSAFSLADGRGPLISVLALVVVGVLLRSGRHATRPAMAVALGLVLGGAFGNLIDRAFRVGDGFLGGGVVDFVDLQWWPVFNVADSAIVVGAVLLFVTQWREGDPADAGDEADGTGADDAAAAAGTGDAAGDAAAGRDAAAGTADAAEPAPPRERPAAGDR